MAKVGYISLLPDILPFVGVCPHPGIIRALQVSAFHFFEESQAYTHKINEQMFPGDNQVEVSDLPRETRLVVPLEIFANGKALDTTSDRILSQEFGEWEGMTADKPKYVMLTSHSRNSLTVVPTVKVGEPMTITGRVAIRPVRLASGLEEDVLEEYAEGLVAGALHRLLSMRQAEWFDPREAKTQLQLFAMHTRAARERTQKKNTSRRLNTSYGGI